MYHGGPKGLAPTSPPLNNKEATPMKTLVLSLLLTPVLAFAQDAAKPGKPGKGGKPGGNRPSPEDQFKKLDTNTDSAVSLDEFKAGPMGKKDPVKAEELFKKLDKDSDGKLTVEEFKTRGPRKGGDKKPGGPKTDAPAAPAAPAPAAPADAEKK